MFVRVLRLILIVALVMTVTMPKAHAVTTNKDQGLTITPISQGLSGKAGETLHGSVSVSNFSSKPLGVIMSTKQFTVTDHSYNYTFEPLVYDWVTMENPGMTLQPSETKKVDFTVTIPSVIAAGGYNFALLATAPLTSASTGQVASLLYVQVDGAGVQRTSSLQNGHVPLIAFSGDIPFRYGIANTGNVAFDAQLSAQLTGVSMNYAVAATSRTVVQQTTRDIQGTLPAPFWPGLYKVTYGYKPDYAASALLASAYVLYVPLWSIVAVVLVVLIALRLWQRYHHKRQA